MANSFSLSGKAALVTGGNGGIGLGMARGLAQAGAALAIAGRDAKKNAAWSTTPAPTSARRRRTTRSSNGARCSTPT